MIIVLEGVDGSGKTTLSRQLCARYNLEYHHEGPLPVGSNALEHYGALLENARWRTYNLDDQSITGTVEGPSPVSSENRKPVATSHGVVFDRLAMGQVIYGPLFRQDTHFGHKEWRVFRRLLDAAGAIEILCLPQYEVCLQNWNARRRSEMVQDEKRFQQVYDGYAEFVARPQYVYDFTQDGAFQRLCHIIEAPRPDPLPPGIIGSVYANILLIGEKSSNNLSPTTDLAFFGTSDSSGFLTHVLDEAGVHETNCAYVNASRHDGKQLKWPALPKVLALGNVASDECVKRSLNHTALPHPSYWKRFHASDVDTYITMLKACLA